MADLIHTLGFDPGSTNMGVSWITCTTDFKTIVHAEATTLSATRGLSRTIRKQHDDRFARLDYLDGCLREFLQDKPFDYAATEGAFINIKRKSAIIPLVLSIGRITSILYDIRQDVYLRWISPGEVKNAVGVKGGNGKDPIPEGVVKTFAAYGYKANIDGLTEHALDSHAVNLANVAKLAKLKG